MKKIKIISRILQIVFFLMMIALPLYTCIFWLSNGHPFGPHFDVAIFPYYGPQLPDIAKLAPNIKVLCFIINLVPIAFGMLVLFFLIRLFNLYGRGHIFTQGNVACYRNVGLMLFLEELIKPIYVFVLTYTMTYHLPAGERYAYFGVNVETIGVLVISLVIILISWIMEEGHKIHEEVVHTV